MCWNLHSTCAYVTDGSLLPKSKALVELLIFISASHLTSWHFPTHILYSSPCRPPVASTSHAMSPFSPFHHSVLPLSPPLPWELLPVFRCLSQMSPPREDFPDESVLFMSSGAPYLNPLKGHLVGWLLPKLKPTKPTLESNGCWLNGETQELLAQLVGM